MSIPKVNEPAPTQGGSTNVWGGILLALLTAFRTSVNALVDVVTTGRLSPGSLSAQIGEKVMAEVGNVEAGGITDSFLAGELADPGSASRAEVLSITGQAVNVTVGPLQRVIQDQLIGRTPEMAFTHPGDSMTDPPTSGAWIEKLQERTGLSHYDDGVGGETSAQIKARVLADTTRRSRRFTLAAGRNDVGGTVPVDQIVGNVRACVDHTFRRRLGLVFDVTRWAGETNGATGSSGVARDRVNAINAALATEFPGMYVEVYKWLQTADAAWAAGITFTADDLVDIANGVTPRSFRLNLTTGKDGGHLNAYGGAAVYYRVCAELWDRGWIDVPPTPVAILAFDNFGRSGGLGNVDDGGKAWGTEGDGTWSVHGGFARVAGAAGFNAAYVTDPAQDISLATRWNLYAGGPGLYWRGDGTNGYICDVSGTSYRIAKKTGGAFATIGAAVNPVTPANGDRIWVRAAGSEHRLYVNGVHAWTAVDNAYSGQRHGVTKYGTGTREFTPFELRRAI